MDKEHVKVADPVHPEYERGFIQGMQMQAQRQAFQDEMYTAGWNEGIRSAMQQAYQVMVLGCVPDGAQYATVRDRLERLLK